MNSFTLFIIAGVVVGILGLYTLFIFLLSSKIKRFEDKIETLFLTRTDLVPSIFEVSKTHLNKHEEVFKEIVVLRKQEFSARENTIGFPGFIQAETLLHHELNFVFKVCNQHQKLLKDGKFLYLRDLLIERSMLISEKMHVYKNIVKKYNWHLRALRFLFIGFLLSPSEISEVS